MTIVFVVLAVSALAVLLLLADRRQRRHGGSMSHGEAGRDKGMPFS